MLKEEREEDIKKTMEIANKSMIAKEKLYEAITVIKKSPKSRILNTKLKEMSQV